MRHLDHSKQNVRNKHDESDYIAGRSSGVHKQQQQSNDNRNRSCHSQEALSPLHVHGLKYSDTAGPTP